MAFLKIHWHLHPLDLGQGRGGECQFISVLFADNPSSFMWHQDTGWVANFQIVDAFRLAIRTWLEAHGENLIGDTPLRMWALHPQNRSSAAAWPRLLNSIQKGGWGDTVSLIASAALLRRSIVVISLSREVGVHEISPTTFSETQTPLSSPILLYHRSEMHYCPLISDQQGTCLGQYLQKRTAQLLNNDFSREWELEQAAVQLAFRPVVVPRAKTLVRDDTRRPGTWAGSC